MSLPGRPKGEYRSAQHEGGPVRAVPAADVAGRITGTVRADILELAAYPVAHAEGCIKLDAMECPYELPEAVRDEIARAVRDTPLNRYPSADLSGLQAAVKTAFGIPDAADVLFGNGSDELIHIMVQACCNPGDVVLSPWPSFVPKFGPLPAMAAGWPSASNTSIWILPLPGRNSLTWRRMSLMALY